MYCMNAITGEVYFSSIVNKRNINNIDFAGFLIHFKQFNTHCTVIIICRIIVLFT